MNPAPSWLGRQYRRARRLVARMAGRGSAQATSDDAGNPVLAGTAAYRRKVESGERPPLAAVGVARECLAADNLPAALRLGYELAAERATTEAGRAVLGLCHLATSGPDQAWHEFSRIADAGLAAAAAPEYFQAGFVAGRDRADRSARGLPDLAPKDRPGAGAVLSTAQHAFSVGLVETAALLVRAARSGSFGQFTDNQAYQFERLATWFPEGSRRRQSELRRADLHFGLIDYKQPDNSSRNVGDFIQTLASLGHLVRQDNLRFVGDPELIGFVDAMRAQVKPERRLDGASATIHLVELQRDGNVYQHLPEPTWAVMFGWYLHPTFSGGYNLPFNPAIRPLFISFHLNKPDALTPEAVAYLRRYAPVGCRDWQTVALLTAAGVPAFFSGCITTTVDTVFARTGPDTRSETGYVDAREGAEEDDNIEQSVGDIRREPLPRNLELAHEWVRRYHEDYARVVTSRLHSYLPARSVGCDVTFGPGNRSDPRFGGLIDIDDDAFEDIRQGILAKLATMVDLLASGAAEEAVYARWRELVAPDVAAADAYLGGFVLTGLALPDLSEQLPTGDRVIVVDAARNQRAVARLAAALERSNPDVAVVAVGAAARDLPGRVHCVTDLPLAERGSTVQRHNLLFAAVLASLPAGCRALVLPADAVVRGDLDGVLGADLGGAPLAAREDIRRNRRDLAALLRRISARQGPDWQAALELVAAGHRRIGHGNVPFDPRVALLEVDGLVAAGWPDLARPLIETYGATWVEALNVLLAGRNRPLAPDTVGNVALEAVDAGAPVLIGFAQSRLSPDVFTTP